MSTMFKITKEKITIKSITLISLGSISLALGVIGIFLPILPTTPFLLLTAWLYAKSSPTLYHWLLTNKYFGKYIRRYRQGLGIPLKTKIIDVTQLKVDMLNFEHEPTEMQRNGLHQFSDSGAKSV